MSQMLQHTSNKAYARDVNNWLATNMWPAHRDARVNDNTDPNTKTDAGILLLQEADPSSNVHKYLCGKGYSRTLDPPPCVQFSVGPIHGFVELGIFHPRDNPWYDGDQVALKYYVSLPYVQLDANVPLFPVDGANTPKIKALYQTLPPMALLVQSLREVSNTPATYPAGFLRLFNQQGAKHVQQFPETSNTFSVRQALLLYGQNTANPIVGTISLDSFLLNAILSIYIPTIGVQLTLDDPLINGLLNFDLNDMGKDLRLVVTMKLNIALIGQFWQTDILIMTMPQPHTPTPLPAPTPAPAPSPGPKPEPKITPRTSRKGDQGSSSLCLPPPLRSAEDFLSPANDGQANTDDELEPEDE
ncbi:hypothetical protein RHS01_11073 [Rhizoctonia solani]|uniref:Uncharacterized protein n=1 Tax=Rhizoctonia solani TaxID=456999 RepID=A0A8H7I3M1_9AGAM|nr:hypothetical protein RHS01_11073 [Rhizoctonia solani]